MTDAPPPPPLPAATAAKPRKRWLVVLVGVMTIVIVIGITGTVLFFTRTWPPLSATQDFVDDLHDGDVNAAFAQVCDRLKTSASRDDFESFARRVEDADSVTVDFLSVDRDGDEATVEFTTSDDDGDDSDTTELRLVHEDGDWRPCGTVRG